MNYNIFVNKSGKLPTQAVIDMQAEFQSLAGKHITVNIEKFKKKSNQQLRYWRGYVVKEFAEFMGYDEDFMHEILKRKCDWWEYKEIDGKMEKINKSITLATTTDFMSIIDKAQRWGAELGLILHDPDENYKGDIEYLDE